MSYHDILCHTFPHQTVPYLTITYHIKTIPYDIRNFLNYWKSKFCRFGAYYEFLNSEDDLIRQVAGDRLLERTCVAPRYVYKERLTTSLYFQSTFLFAAPTMAETQQTTCLTVQTSALLGICFDYMPTWQAAVAGVVAAGSLDFTSAIIFINCISYNFRAFFSSCICVHSSVSRNQRIFACQGIIFFLQLFSHRPVAHGTSNAVEKRWRS